jgi:hypothetical protein
MQESSLLQAQCGKFQDPASAGPVADSGAQYGLRMRRFYISKYYPTSNPSNYAKYSIFSYNRVSTSNSSINNFLRGQT